MKKLSNLFKKRFNNSNIEYIYENEFNSNYLSKHNIYSSYNKNSYLNSNSNNTNANTVLLNEKNYIFKLFQNIFIFSIYYFS